tara:strand:- start:11040 stop:11558 length:519 start_codon:yes stop_codon:yes gene_type:complete
MKNSELTKNQQDILNSITLEFEKKNKERSSISHSIINVKEIIDEVEARKIWIEGVSQENKRFQLLRNEARSADMESIRKDLNSLGLDAVLKNDYIFIFIPDCGDDHGFHLEYVDRQYVERTRGTETRRVYTDYTVRVYNTASFGVKNQTFLECVAGAEFTRRIKGLHASAIQ